MKHAMFLVDEELGNTNTAVGAGLNDHNLQRSSIRPPPPSQLDQPVTNINPNGNLDDNQSIDLERIRNQTIWTAYPNSITSNNDVVLQVNVLEALSTSAGHPLYIIKEEKVEQEEGRHNWSNQAQLIVSYLSVGLRSMWKLLRGGSK